jgi:BirA family biotin operon repressor/biotin-[acetyl-CoA-carboxylase] ligase
MKDKILSHLPPDHPWGQTVYWYDSIPSTNAAAKVLAASNAPHGTVLLADSQTAGRGRLGRSFHSPAGSGLYMSVILRPNCQPTELMHQTCAVGVAVCDAVEEVSGIRPGIKWINDLLLDGKKLGGILTELSMNGSNVDYAVVGIGINCNQATIDFPPELQDIACSLSSALSKPIDRARLAAALIFHLEIMSRKLFHPQAVMARYRRDCVTIGKDVMIHRNDTATTGHALNVENDGSLLVRLQDGSIQTVNSGEVSIRGLFGYV